MSVRVVDAGRVGDACSRGNTGWITPSLAAPLPAPGVGRMALRSVASPASPLKIAPRRVVRHFPWFARFAMSARRRRYVAGLEPLRRFALRSIELYEDLVRAGVPFQLHRSGFLFVYTDTGAARRARAAIEGGARHGLSAPGPLLEAGQLHEVEPALSPAARAGFVTGDDGYVDPRALTGALAEELRLGGVSIDEQRPVLDVVRKRSQVGALVTSRGDIRAGSVLLAAGAGTAALARRVGVHLPLEIGKGYSFALRPARRVRRPVVLAEHRLACSPLGDLLRVSGGMELAGEELRIDTRRLRSMATSAQRYFSVGSVSDSWAGQRTLSPDGLPLVGRLPSFDNVYVSCGHAMLGVTLATASGTAIARLIADGVRNDLIRSCEWPRAHAR